MLPCVDRRVAAQRFSCVAATLRFHRMQAIDCFPWLDAPRESSSLYTEFLRAPVLLPDGALFFHSSHPPIFGARPQQNRLPSAKGGIAELSSTGPQRRQGDLYIADGT